MANKKLAGVTLASVDGVYFDIIEASWYGGGLKREAMTSLSPYGGEYKETPIPATIKLKVRDTSDLTVADFGSMVGVTVVVEHGNGKVITGYEMTCTAEYDNDVGGDASFSLEFFGPRVEETI